MTVSFRLYCQDEGERTVVKERELRLRLLATSFVLFYGGCFFSMIHLNEFELDYILSVQFSKF